MGGLPVIRRMAVLLVAVFLGLWTAAAPAWAHEALNASEPAADSVLAEAPPHVRLVFSGTVVDPAPTLVLRDSTGAEVPGAAPVVDGPTVTLPIEQQLANGGYAVEWRIVSSDGDPVSGSFAFTVEAPAPVAAPVTPAPSSSSSAPAPTPEPAASSTEAEAGGGTPVWPWLVAGAVVLAMVAGVLAVRKRGRSGPA